MNVAKSPRLAAHITSLQDKDGRTAWAVWAYDLDAPRDPENVNPAMRYAVHGIVGIYQTKTKAEKVADPIGHLTE